MWNKLYNSARKVQNGRTISPFIDAGGVAAAILTKKGNIYVGVCIDTASTLGMCAERNAIADGMRPDVIVVDPPRKGCDDALLNALIAAKLPKIAYVSCNPATQIRDLAEFAKAGYKVVEVQPFDLFPQTKHLECVATLEKMS